VISRAVGNPEEWVPLVGSHLAGSARVALFQGSPDVPEIRGFERGEVYRLPRGEANFLVTLNVPRGTA
jgi:hypothetical protein